MLPMQGQDSLGSSRDFRVQPEQPALPGGSLTLGRSSFLRATASSLASYSACTWSLFFNTLCGRQKGEACHTQLTTGPPSPGDHVFTPSLPNQGPQAQPRAPRMAWLCVTCGMDSGGGRVFVVVVNLFTNINSSKHSPAGEERGQSWYKRPSKT